MSTTTTKFMTKGELSVLKAQCRKMFAIRSSRQGLAAKAALIRKGKGRNGKSMNPALMARHMAVLP